MNPGEKQEKNLKKASYTRVCYSSTKATSMRCMRLDGVRCAIAREKTERRKGRWGEKGAVKPSSHILSLNGPSSTNRPVDQKEDNLVEGAKMGPQRDDQHGWKRSRDPQSLEPSNHHAHIRKDPLKKEPKGEKECHVDRR